MNPANDYEQRLVALEERLTFQQRLIEELNGVVLDQRREFDRLARELAQCRQTLEQFRDAALGENLPHEKPPHY
jgi:SlyX protein